MITEVQIDAIVSNSLILETKTNRFKLDRPRLASPAGAKRPPSAVGRVVVLKLHTTQAKKLNITQTKNCTTQAENKHPRRAQNEHPIPANNHINYTENRGVVGCQVPPL